MATPSTSAPEEAEPIPDLLALFAERAEPLGVRVERGAGPEDAAASIAALAAELAAPRPLLAAELRDAAPRLVAALATAGLAWDPPGEPAATRDAALGISLARLAVAETASA